MPNQEGVGSIGVIGRDNSSALEKSTTSSARGTQPPRRELGQVPEDIRGEGSGLGDVRRGVSLSAENDDSDAKMSFSDGEGGASPGSPSFEFVWVASDEGEAGPHTAVAPRDAEWAAVARNVRFRLASAWLSCAQVRNKRTMQRISIVEPNVHVYLCILSPPDPGISRRKVLKPSSVFVHSSLIASLARLWNWPGCFHTPLRPPSIPPPHAL